MNSDKTDATDEMTAESSPGLIPERREYVVTSEDGLFKNGKLYKQGDKVELDARTAANFAANGDIESEE